MWVLYQTSKDLRKKKFVVSDDYNKLIDYIKEFSHIKKYGENHFESNNGEILFDIYLSTKL